MMVYNNCIHPAVFISEIFSYHSDAKGAVCRYGQSLIGYGWMNQTVPLAFNKNI